MKRSHTQGNAVLRDEDGTIYGVLLAADYVGQHEGGIERLQQTFGIKGGDADFAGHSATWDLSDRVHLMPIEHERREGRRRIVEQGLAVTTDRPDAGMLGEFLQRYDDAPVIGAWDDSDFAIAGYGDEGQAVVRMITDAVSNVDLAIWIGGVGGNPFARGGLAIARNSLVPKDLIATFDQTKQAERALKAAADATGIAERLLAMRARHGLVSLSPYHALSPKWTPAERNGDTAHRVIFFLNPSDGQRNNHGWFTVEELDQWIIGKGPIPKEAS